MPSPTNYAIGTVKSNKSERFMPSLKTQRILAKWYRLITPYIGYGIGAIVLFLVLVDSIVNNWAIIDFCGNGSQFRTPVANAKNAMDLLSIYSFANGFGLLNLSEIGFWMADFTTTSVATNPSGIYLLTGGTYEIIGTMNFCNSFTNSYFIDITKPVKLAVANDAITFLRGDAISHAFTNDLIDNLPTINSTIPEIQLLGYKGARIQTDLRMTMEFNVKNITSTQSYHVNMYRIYSKAYCTGCIPIAELGHGICNLTMKYNSSTNILHVISAKSVLNSLYDTGYMFQRSIYSTFAVFLKYIAIFIAIAGYLASRKTVQWQEVHDDKVETVWNRIIQTIAPKYFPHLSYAIRFDIFCYNSDIFVLLIVISTILDMSQALMYVREVNYFNALSPNNIISLQLFAISSRLLWLNVGIVKIWKLLLNLIFPATYCGESRLMPFFNFSSVTTVYLSAIMLYYVPPYIEYNNKGRWDVFNHNQRLDGQVVNYFESFYFRGAPAIGFGLVGNVHIILAFDHLSMFLFWKQLKKNSLSRQAIYNSTSIICEYVQDIQIHDGNFVIIAKARRLSTLQWYFMSHMICFALPEKEMSKKKTKGGSNSTTKGESNESGQILYTVGQGDGGHFHLFDQNLADVKSLPFNIKLLKNTPVIIR